MSAEEVQESHEKTSFDQSCKCAENKLASYLKKVGEQAMKENTSVL